MSFYTIGTKNYFIGNCGNIETAFEISPYTQLTRIILVNRNQLVPIQPFELTSIKESIRIILNKYEEASKIIWKALGGTPEGTKNDLQCNFTNWIIQNKHHEKTELTLNNLNLEILPPQIGLFTHLKTLDLSNNNLYLLPPELQTFNQLETLIISGNKKLPMNIPSWLGSMACNVFAYDLNLRYLPKNLRADQVVCEVDFTSYDYLLGLTQPLYDDKNPTS